MAKNNEKALTKSSIAQVSKLMKSVTTESFKWPYVSVASERTFYVTELEVSSWKTIQKKAQDRRKKYEAALASITECEAKLETLAEYSKQIKKMFSAPLGIPIKKPNASEIRKNISATLLKKGIDPKIVKSIMKKPSKSSSVKAGSFLKHYVANKETLIEQKKPELLKSLMASILADTVASFNLTAKSAKANANAKEISGWSKKSAKALDAAELAIYKALAHKDFAKLQKLGKDLASAAQKIVTEGLRKNAALLKSAKAATSSRKEAFGNASLDLGNVLRTALRGVALSQFIKYAASEPTTFEHWARSAAKLPYNGRSSSFPLYTLSGLKKAQLRTGQNITVQGAIKDVILIRLKNKYVSLADLTDKAGNRFTAVLPYIKIDSGGLVPGSTVHIAGAYHKQAVRRHLPTVPEKFKKQIADLNPEGVIVDRLNYGKLSKRSWQDWATQELSFMFTAVPHGLNMSWSWQAGSNGPANQLRYGTWCGR